MVKRDKSPAVETDLKPRITVIGVGGAGGNAVNNMIRSKLEGVEFLVTNTDAQAIQQSFASSRIQLGLGVTQGLGAGSKPEVGRAAAEESLEEILEHLNESNMLFITAGMGGGTGTGAAPVIARAARDLGILTIGVVTKPFHFEGAHRMRTAESGIQELQQYVDTLIVIPNQNLFRIANERTTFADAFNMADDVLYSGVRGVTDLMVMPGLINLDFADIRVVMGEMGKAMMGTGEAEGDRRAIEAAEAAISNPLLDDVSMKGARGVLINITGGFDMTLYEVDEAANRIRDEVDPDANIIFGSTFDEKLNGRMRVSVVATGIDAQTQIMPLRRAPVLETGSASVASFAAARESVRAGPVSASQDARARALGGKVTTSRPIVADRMNVHEHTGHDALNGEDSAWGDEPPFDLARMSNDLAAMAARGGGQRSGAGGHIAGDLSHQNSDFSMTALGDAHNGDDPQQTRLFNEPPSQQEDRRTTPASAKPKKMGFLERLSGGRIKSRASAEADHTRTASVVADHGRVMPLRDEDVDTLDIPAFLRKQDGA